MNKCSVIDCPHIPHDHPEESEPITETVMPLWREFLATIESHGCADDGIMCGYCARLALLTDKLRVEGSTRSRRI